MKFRLLSFIVFALIWCMSFGQNKIDVKAKFDIEKKQIKISQTIQYHNTTNDELQTIYLNDWNNSYATKSTPLAIRIADEYKNVFHFAKNEDRGYSVITAIKQGGEQLSFHRVKNQIDIVEVQLARPLKPNGNYTIDLEYVVQIPSDKFTSYGITDSEDINLRYWYITPAVYNGAWKYFSNKDLDDLYIPQADVTLDLEFPENYILTSELDVASTNTADDIQQVTLNGKDRTNNKLFLNTTRKFSTIKSVDFSLISDINDEGLQTLNKVLITEKIIKFVNENFGAYPHEKLLVSDIDFKKSPIYGLNFLPKFIKPYPIHFNYEIKILKLAIQNYLENTLLINPREEQWLFDGLQVYYLMNYVNQHYPKMKFLGSIAGFWGVKSFHVADMHFNEKYMLAFMGMARTNRDQPLTMHKDSLLKFNKNIANKYKAGVGLKYLDDYINADILETSITSFLKDNQLKPTSTLAFEDFLKSRTSKNIDWFFNDYLKTRKKIDYKIKRVSKTEDSITLTIKNKRDSSMPISLYTLNNDSVISKTWIDKILDTKTLTLPRNGANKLVLNYEKMIPEINTRDNWKSLKGFFFNNKPLQFRVFKDIEDPHYNQVFFLPVGQFNNIYDGITLGMRMYNTTVLRRRFNYKIEPQYAFGSKSLTGSAAASVIHNLENSDLYYINYGIRAGYSSYAEDLFVRRIIPSLTLYFRENNDFRSNKRKSLKFRYIDINRDRDTSNPQNSTEPNYSVFNIRYINSDDNLINFSKWHTDLQIAKKFTKLSFNYEYRRLFESNRQLNLRVFTGLFLKNRNSINSDYFSFALDRPTDYLFDYAYLGRSEASGIFSQQYIAAEGGFKSKLETPFANEWLTTLNTSTTLWKYVLGYGDVGFLKNRFKDPKFVYNFGLRINLVTDYFEIYLPVYSNLGWEISQPNYDEKIRFKFTVDPNSLLGLFRRRWY